MLPVLKRKKNGPVQGRRGGRYCGCKKRSTTSLLRRFRAQRLLRERELSRKLINQSSGKKTQSMKARSKSYLLGGEGGIMVQTRRRARLLDKKGNWENRLIKTRVVKDFYGRGAGSKRPRARQRKRQLRGSKQEKRIPLRPEKIQRPPRKTRG